MNSTTAIAGSSPTISYRRLSKAEGIALSSVFIMASLFIVAGNFLTIVLFALSKKLRKRSLILVMNMAVSDLLLGAVSLPIYIYRNADYFRLGKVKTNQYLFSRTFFSTLFSRKYRLFLLSQSHWRGFTPSVGLLDTEPCPCERIRLVFFLPGQLLCCFDPLLIGLVKLVEGCVLCADELCSDNAIDCLWLQYRH